MKIKRAEIHFIDKEYLELNEVEMEYNDYGIIAYGSEENVFVPYSNIRFVREFKNEDSETT